MWIDPFEEDNKRARLEKLLEKAGYKPEHHVKIPERPSVIETFMEMALKASLRSPDPNSKVGCIITDADNRILSTGYNGYPRKIDYSFLPNTRPLKYKWYKHAEINGLAWCKVRPVGGYAYVTHKCCFDCLTTLWQHGIEILYQGNMRAKMTEETPEEEAEREIFLLLSGMQVCDVNFPA